MLGITQEQHPDRCRLFAQWQQFDWPIVWDPINSLESTAVPIVVAIDEHGIVRSTRPRPETFEQEFLNVSFRDDASPASTPARAASGRTIKPDVSALKARADQTKTGRAFRDWADASVLWGGEAEIDTAIMAYSRSLALEPDDANALFRLGVAFRLRHDSARRESADFQRAVEQWEQALARNPNQYIWRRRIQQFGPRLDKPYSFYDWVEQARREIAARGTTPTTLTVDPYGAELAYPIRAFAAEAAATKPPDPDGKVQRDTTPLVQSEVTLVPSRLRPSGSARVHIALTPNAAVKAHWNNEADPLRVWVDVPKGWKVSQQSHSVPGPGKQETSTELRRIDFEVQSPADATGTVKLPVYALYFVCEDESGTCLFLRLDLAVNVDVVTTDSTKAAK
ncbi:MAG: tetratricopeptide repeat protein [Pirellulaceae bacterium]